MGTISKEFTLKSVALMTGLDSEAKVCPAKEKGIRFHYAGKFVEANIDNVVSTEHCTVIGNNEIKIMLIEHFMAACAICGIDSIDVYLSHFELPILDGASKIWINAFNTAGINNPVTTKYTVKEPLKYLNGKTHLVVLPSDELNVTYSVNFKHKDLKNRWVNVDFKKLDEIRDARTFGFYKDLKKFQMLGFAQGVTQENTVGLLDEGFTTNLRSPYEPVKHKILDLLGDFYLTGVNPLHLKAQILVKEAGHAVHLKTAKILKEKLKEV